MQNKNNELNRRQGNSTGQRPKICAAKLGNKKLLKTIKPANKHAEAKIKGKRKVLHETIDCEAKEERIKQLIKYASKREDSEKRTKQKPVERRNIRKHKIAERKETKKSYK